MGPKLFSNASALEDGSEQLTVRPLNRLSSAKFLVCFNFQSASKLPKTGENAVCVSNSLGLGETIVVLGGLRVKQLHQVEFTLPVPGENNCRGWGQHPLMK